MTPQNPAPRPIRSGVMRRPWRRLALNRRVLVNLKTEKAISGVLWDERDGILVLKDAALHTPGHEPAAIDGEVLIDRADVDFAQILGPRSS